MSVLPKHRLEKHEPAYSQIGKVIRESISNGELKPGTRLPDVRSMAKHYGTSVFTIHTALNMLADDGLIDRVRNRGTFVTNSGAKLRRVGLYSGSRLIFDRSREFYRELYRLLRENLAERDVEVVHWVDNRYGEHAEPLPEMAQLVARHGVQGVIAGSVTYSEFTALQSLGAPLSLFTSAEGPFQVSTATDAAIDLAFNEFRRLGCSTVGGIFPVSAMMRDPKQLETAPIYRRLFTRFTDQLAEHSLKTRDAWVRVSDKIILATEHEEYGYRKFRAIWSSAERPEALLIWPDTVARGAIAAMLELGVRVPQDLKLVVHKNDGIPLLCPYPAAKIVTYPSLIAQTLVDQLARQVAGESTQPVLISPALEASPC